MASVHLLVDKFRPTQVLRTDTQTKSLALLGDIDGQQAIVTLEKTAFAAPALGDFRLAELVEQMRPLDSNDVYFWNVARLAQDLDTHAGAKVNVIFPATDTHVRKYAAQKHHMVEETPEVYERVVRPYIATQRGSRIQWVHNILFEGKEADAVVHHDEDPAAGFVLLPDMKWDRVSTDALYLVAIVKRTDLASVRDLTGAHRPFLVALRDKIRAATAAAYSVAPDTLRMFVHYQPSYYHLHVHVVNVAHPGLGDGLAAGKAILLDDVIDNIALVPDYYQKRTMYYSLGENHALWAKLQE